MYHVGATSNILESGSAENDMEVAVNVQNFTQVGIMFIIALAIVITNVLVIATFLNFRGTKPNTPSNSNLNYYCDLLGPSEVINCYLLSLAVADLLCGLVVVPLTLYVAMAQTWKYTAIVCRLVGYLEVTLWAVTVYTFMWISVDRYLAVRKPLRYETLQTKTRCQCWMAFTWISAAMLCCPPLLSFDEPIFEKEAYICMLDWGSMAAYSVTLAILVLGPSLITIVYTYTYIFNMLRKLRSGYPFHDKEYATALSENLSNPSHVMSFSLVVVFWMSWTPYIGVRLYEYFTGVKLQVQFLHFGIVCLGFLNSFWKSIILITMSPQFRLALRIFCMTICCRYKGRMQAELIGMEADD